MVFPNGFIKYDCLTYGCEAFVYCDQGFDLIIGDSIQQCGRSSKWSGDRPLCGKKG